MKTSEKANMHNRAGLPQPHLLALYTLGTQEGTMKDVCRLPYVSTSVASRSQTPRATSRTPRVTAYS